MNKTCKTCFQDKDESLFPKQSRSCSECFRKAKRESQKRYRQSPMGKAYQTALQQRPGYEDRKRVCERTPKAKARRHRYQQDPERKKAVREEILRKHYGLTVEGYDTILKSQGGVCAICGCTPAENGKALSVDHDHKTGKVRGLLCHPCNFGLGGFKDNPVSTARAADYLRLHSSVQTNSGTGWISSSPCISPDNALPSAEK